MLFFLGGGLGVWGLWFDLIFQGVSVRTLVHAYNNVSAAKKNVH